MVNAEILSAAEQRRLAWRCRRGLLELDIVLQQFVLAQFSQMTLAELTEFDDLLALPDTEFWQLIQGQAVGHPLAKRYATLLEKLRSSHRTGAEELL